MADPQIHARDLGRRGPLTPFSHLARTQLWSVAGDALVTIGLSTSVFFNGDPKAPREKVALYLVLTLAPFTLAIPIIGPTLDRLVGGRRWMIFGAAVARVFIAFLLVRDLDNAFFYLWAFLMLVLSKVHLISKSAVLPTTVRSDAELVEANSKLSLLGTLAGVVAGGPGLLLSRIGGPQWSIGLAMGAFVLTAIQAFNLPDTKVAAEPAGVEERNELQGAGIIRAAEAMSALRFVVGFLTFAILFDFRSAERDNYWYGVAALSAQGGYLLGSGLAPVFRRRLVEEHLVMIGVGFTCVMAAISSWSDGLGGAAMLAFAVGSTASLAKQGFDSLVQRDAPDANRGRSFARFESRFQLVWVLGAFIPVVLPIPQKAAFLTISLVCLIAGTSYVLGYRQIKAAAAGLRPPIPPRLPIYQRLYYLAKPSARPAPYDPSQRSVPHEIDPYATGFLIDPLDPLDPLEPLDPTAVAPSAGRAAVPAPALAPSNPLVGGRWRSPEPEELFAPEEHALPGPPPEVTPTGLFAPAVAGAAHPTPAPPAEAPRDPTIPWFESVPFVGTLPDMTAPLTPPRPVVTSGPAPAPEPAPDTTPEAPAPPAAMAAPAAANPPPAVPTVPTGPAVAPPPTVPHPEPGVDAALDDDTPIPAFDTVITGGPTREPASVDGWEIQQPRWRDAGAQPLPGFDTLDGEPPDEPA